MLLLKRFFQLLIVTNIWIACCSFFFFFANCILLGIPFDQVVNPSIFVFSSTWFIYQLSRFFYHKRNTYTYENDILNIWLSKNQKFTLFSIIFSGIISFIFFLFLIPKAKLFMIFLGTLSFFYPLPLPFKNNKNQQPYRLRDFPFIKIFLISFTWAATCVILPAFQAQLIIPIHLFFLQFLFIFFITIPFDINDMEIDSLNKIKTIPNLLGLTKTLILEGIILFELVFFHSIWKDKIGMISFNQRLYINLILFYVLLYLITIIYAKKLPKWSIMLIFDGSMIIYFILVVLFKKVIAI